MRYARRHMCLASPPCAMQSTTAHARHPGLDQSSLRSPCSGTSSVPLCINAVGRKVSSRSGSYINGTDIKHLRLLCYWPASGPWRRCSVERTLALRPRDRCSMHDATRNMGWGWAKEAAHVRCSASEPPPARHAPIRMRSRHFQNRGDRISILSCCVFLHTPSPIVRRG